MKVSEHDTVPYFTEVPASTVTIPNALRGARRRTLFTHVIGLLSTLAVYAPYGTERGDWNDYPFYDTSKPQAKRGDYSRESQSAA
jgi:hypothetical protein